VKERSPWLSKEREQNKNLHGLFSFLPA
jgi:hypothetical protein